MWVTLERFLRGRERVKAIGRQIAAALRRRRLDTDLISD